MAPAAAIDLPCDGDGVCMACKATPPEAEILLCGTCAAPWHAQCLSSPPASMSAVYNWQCPDCNPAPDAAAHSSSVAPSGAHSELVAAIRAIEADETLTEQEKARRRQALVGRVNMPPEDDDESDEDDGKNKGKSNDVLNLLDEKFNCAFCMQLPERPVSTPCGHNFCLKCFQKWVRQGGHTCVKCRAPFPAKMAAQPRINSALVIAIRMAKTARSSTTGGPIHIQHFIRNENRPEKAFTTERAKKPGKANACSGQIFVTVPPDHFGPILAENDPRRKQGVLVGETWEDRMECRQWGAHLPHVAGIAGQSDYGAQSVALSGGYKDDEDHGEWFLYTGSGGRDLSGNKRTNKEQSFDQKFEKLNAALKVSCLKGYPVRVVRSHKEKRSSYAPEGGVRYDGIYRIEKCWRKIGIQGFKVCRYLFVRCDNEPAPWTSDEYGDRPRPLPAIKELKNATDIAERQENPSWDYHEKQGWKWMKPPPASRKPVSSANLDERKYTRKHVHHTSMERLLKEFSCLICRKVMTLPVTTPCGHNFCQSCLLGAFEDKSFVRERGSGSGRTLRAKKIVKKCPTCPTDISDFLQNPQVNRELSDVIESLQRKIEEENMRLQIEANNDVSEGSGEDRSDDLQENVSREDKSRVMEMANEEINVGAAMKFTMQESGTVGDESKSLDGRSDVNPAVEGMGKAPMHEGTQSLLSQKRKSYPVQEPDSNKINLNEAAETSDGISTSEESDVENAMLHGSKENLDVNVLKSEMQEDAKVVVQNQVNDTELPVYGMRTRTVKKARKETDISEAQ